MDRVKVTIKIYSTHNSRGPWKARCFVVGGVNGERFVVDKWGIKIFGGRYYFYYYRGFLCFTVPPPLSS